ncbi:MAG: amidoligase family protein [Bacteroidota bacterium]|nr:amidoligase family protein [Bacteroidota bacterium]
MKFELPPLLYTEEGNLRRAGFELEYSNVGMEESVKIIQELYGGEVQVENRFSQKVTNTTLGDFSVEFDLTLLTEKNYKKLFDKFNIRLEEIKLGEGTLEEGVETVLESIVGKVFPYEIATPPVPITQLEQLEKLRESLFRYQAKGTEDFLTNAFGTHINVELPQRDIITLHRYLQAFLLLYPWLLQVGETNLARKVSPFIDPYPVTYTELVLNPDYKPDLQDFIRNYHQFNPDRNRPLDLYPLFAALDKELIASYSDLGKVKPRYTFHYRLPNSNVSKPDWTLAQEWNNWVAIEILANEPEKLASMSEEYVNLKKNTLVGFEGKWAKKTEQWLAA